MGDERRLGMASDEASWCKERKLFNKGMRGDRSAEGKRKGEKEHVLYYLPSARQVWIPHPNVRNMSQNFSERMSISSFLILK